MKKVFVFFIFLIISIHCTNSDKFEIIGHWIIDKMTYRKLDLTNEAFTLNVISSYNGIEYNLPSLLELNEDKSAREGRASYFRKSNKRYVFFKTSNQFFNDTFEIRLIRKDTFEIFNKEKYAKFHNAYIYSH